MSHISIRHPSCENVHNLVMSHVQMSYVTHINKASSSVWTCPWGSLLRVISLQRTLQHTATYCNTLAFPSAGLSQQKKLWHCKRDCWYHIILQIYNVGLRSRRHPMTCIWNERLTWPFFDFFYLLIMCFIALSQRLGCENSSAGSYCTISRRAHRMVRT